MAGCGGEFSFSKILVNRLGAELVQKTNNSCFGTRGHVVFRSLFLSLFLCLLPLYFFGILFGVFMEATFSLSDVFMCQLTDTKFTRERENAAYAFVAVYIYVLHEWLL